MNLQIIFSNYELKQYILSFIFSLDYILKYDLVYIFRYHEENIDYMDLILNDNVLNLAIKYDSIKIVNWLINKNIIGSELTLSLAILSNNLNYLIIFRQYHQCCSFDIFKECAQYFDINMLKWLFLHYIQFIPETLYIELFNCSILGEKIDNLKFIYNQYIFYFNKHFEFNQNLIYICIYTGNDKILKWIINNSNQCSYNEIIYACRYNHLNILKWLLNIRIPNYNNTNLEDIDIIIGLKKGILWAIKNNNLDMIKYINNYYYDISITNIKEIINLICKYNNFEILKYFQEKFINYKHIFSYNTINYCVRSNNLDIVKYIYNYIPYDVFLRDKKLNNKSNLEIAIKNNNIELFNWLNINLPEKNSNLLYYAVKNNNIEITKILLETRKDQFINNKIIIAAILKNNISLIKLIIKNYSNIDLESIIYNSLSVGNKEIIKFIINYYNIETVNIDYCVKSRNIDTIIWLNNFVNCTCTTDAMDLAAINGDLNIVKWLHYNRSEGCSKSAIDGAANNGHINIIRWLYKNRNEGATEASLYSAALNGNIVIVKFLINNLKIKFNKVLILKTFLKGYFTISNILSLNYNNLNL